MRDGRIEYLIRLVEKSDIAELEITEGWGKKIRISKGSSAPAGGPMIASSNLIPMENAASIAPGDPANANVNSEEENWTPVVAPIVGTYYRSANPQTAPFVEIGSAVTVGQTLCIIEAMKIMNEIPAEIQGNVRKILVENGQPVEFGETLFLIEKAT